MASQAPDPATAAMSKFERDTQVRRIDERVWEGNFSPGLEHRAGAQRRLCHGARGARTGGGPAASRSQ